MNPSRCVCVTYFSSFIAKSQLNDLDDIGQGQGSLRATHPLMWPFTSEFSHLSTRQFSWWSFERGLSLVPEIWSKAMHDYMVENRLSPSSYHIGCVFKRFMRERATHRQACLILRAAMPIASWTKTLADMKKGCFVDKISDMKSDSWSKHS